MHIFFSSSLPIPKSGASIADLVLLAAKLGVIPAPMAIWRPSNPLEALQHTLKASYYGDAIPIRFFSHHTSTVSRAASFFLRLHV